MAKTIRFAEKRRPRRRMMWLACAFLTGIIVSDARADNDVVRLAASTSTANSGLMAMLMPKFAEDTKFRLELTPVATGKALRLGRDGKVDVLLVHSPPAEKQFVATGHGIARIHVMHNDLVVAGPATDPALINSAPDVIEAFRRISAGKIAFVSRGDDSGNHRQELILWKEVGIEPFGLWYREAGRGMGGTLEIANRESSYLLIDRGTWLKRRSKVDLVLLFEGDERLRNNYTAIAVNPAKHPKVNHQGSEVFIDWITSPRIAELIASYRIDGEQLYVPYTLAEN